MPIPEEAVMIEKGSALSSLSLTPLIDIVFLLLIFFLAVATRFADEETKFAREERELDVMLPEASEAKPLSVDPDETIIVIDEQGRYFVKDSMVSLKQLDRILKQVRVNNPGRESVVIQADGNVKYAYVVAAMNSCMKAKIRNYTFSAQTKAVKK